RRRRGGKEPDHAREPGSRREAGARWSRGEGPQLRRQVNEGRESTMIRYLSIVAVIAIAACDNGSSSGGEPPSASGAKPAAAATATQESVANSDTKTVWTVAVGSPDHTTLVAAVKAADLVEVLASPGGVYTVFAPTNAAFDKLPK